MKCKGRFTKKDVIVILGCAVFALANLGAIGSSGRRRAKEFVCLSNLLRWGAVFRAFINDNGGYFADRSEMIDWPETLRSYYRNPKMLLCPEATKTYDEGGRNPFMAWWYEDTGDAASYCLHLWVSNEPSAYFWSTAYVRGADKVPILADGQWKDADPLHIDEPPEHEDDFWTPGRDEIRRFCVNRHNGGVNGVCLDFSVRKIGLKELWELHWHRNWNPDNYPPPLWPPWMENFKDYYP